MATSNEHELTYLAKNLPENIDQYPHKLIEDIYFPAEAVHPRLRIRRQDDSYAITRKTPLDASDAGAQQEENTIIDADEYSALAAGRGRSLSKIRYLMPYKGLTAEIDIFKGPLEGLVIIEFEFTTPEEKAAFATPDFCLADVTQEDFIAGGMLAGKSYTDIDVDLKRFDYEAPSGLSSVNM